MTYLASRPVEWIEHLLWAGALGDAWRQADRAQVMGKGRSRAAARRRTIRQAAWDSLMDRDLGVNLPFLPDWVCAPGETVKEILDDRDLTLRDFAAQLGCTVKHVDGLMRGLVRIDAPLAQRLAEVLGASERFWLNRDQQYVDDCRRLGLPLGGAA